ncbi:MAG: M28 family peptidase, partial [Desulfobulbaceae bacterium]|nr:M28 family peptidase [Desulfobulbaceae bacterium]
MSYSLRIICFILISFNILCNSAASQTEVNASSIYKTIETLSSFESRTTGSAGYEKAANYIEQRLQELGLETDSHYYEIPVRRSHGATLSIDGTSHPLKPFIYNSITPESTDGVISAPLYYVGKGNLQELDGKNIRDAIILMDFDSGRNWQILASLGAKALIYLEVESTAGKVFFTEKHELSPLQFPCFWMTKKTAGDLFGSYTENESAPIAQVELQSTTVWENFLARNIYALIPGTDPQLKQELLILEAFFDNKEFVSGDSPGADAATSIATLLETAKALSQKPQGRSVILIATSGNSQTLAGMRDTIWSMNERSKELRGYKRQLQKTGRETRTNLEMLKNLQFPLTEDKERDTLLG